MTATVYVAIFLWAFLIGFMLGISFPDNKKPKAVTDKISTVFNKSDFSMTDEQYRNFLSYDGTVQKGVNYGRK
ncbi:MAG: hypothetical protein MJ080_00600 [Clostridia bacterium]|nr:hypothetical protein [Clostridia bacterium]